MRFIKKQLSLWRIVLIIGVAAIAIPIAARVSPTAIAVVNERHENLAQQTANDNEDRTPNTARTAKLPSAGASGGRRTTTMTGVDSTGRSASIVGSMRIWTRKPDDKDSGRQGQQSQQRRRRRRR